MRWGPEPHPKERHPTCDVLAGVASNGQHNETQEGLVQPRGLAHGLNGACRTRQRNAGLFGRGLTVRVQHAQGGHLWGMDGLNGPKSKADPH
jgi:hypothetical protein